MYDEQRAELVSFCRLCYERGHVAGNSDNINTITVDNSSEFADYQNLAKELLHTHLFPHPLLVLLRKKG